MRAEGISGSSAPVEKSGSRNWPCRAVLRRLQRPISSWKLGHSIVSAKLIVAIIFAITGSLVACNAAAESPAFKELQGYRGICQMAIRALDSDPSTYERDFGPLVRKRALETYRVPSQLDMHGTVWQTDYRQLSLKYLETEQKVMVLEIRAKSPAAIKRMGFEASSALIQRAYGPPDENGIHAIRYFCEFYEVEFDFDVKGKVRTLILSGRVD